MMLLPLTVLSLVLFFHHHGTTTTPTRTATFVVEGFSQHAFRSRSRITTTSPFLPPDVIVTRRTSRTPKATTTTPTGHSQLWMSGTIDATNESNSNEQETVNKDATTTTMTLPAKTGDETNESSDNTDDGVVCTTSSIKTTSASSSTNTNGTTNDETSKKQNQRRILGSQELLMLPRQYKPEETQNKFPQMTHVMAVTLNRTPTTEHLKEALRNVMNVHPLLRCHVEGTGEPDRRIDLFQMVRSPNNPNPETFVVPTSMEECDTFSVEDVLKVIDVSTNSQVDSDNEKKSNNDLSFLVENSWKQSFEYNLDHTNFDTQKGPLWNVELHRLGTSSSNDSNKPCALVFTFNHVISDQSSANMLIDHLLTELVSCDSSYKKKKTIKSLDIPNSMEQCTLGKEHTYEAMGGTPTNNPELVSFDTFKYVAGKAMEGFKNAPILPDGGGSGDSSNLGNALQTISGQAAGGSVDDSADKDESNQMNYGRRSMVEHRTLSKEIVTNLVKQCRQKDVTLSNLLTSIMVYTSSNFISSDAASTDGIEREVKDETDQISNIAVEVENNAMNPTSGSDTLDDTIGEITSTTATSTTSTIPPAQMKKKSRYYKVLQSLDFRRFGINPDPCRTMSCQAGSHDLILGPIEDGSGNDIIRQDDNDDTLEDSIWKMAKISRDQTKQFFDSNGPVNAVRVFDFAMTQTDMNNLVDLTAKSKSSQGRAYTAGVTNAGVYESTNACLVQYIEDDDSNNKSKNPKKGEKVKTKHGKYTINDIYYATSHARTGSLYQLSLLTVDGEMKLTFHPVSPIVSRETSQKFANDFVELATKIAIEGNLASDNDGVNAITNGIGTFLKTNGLVLATTLVGAYSVNLHTDAWIQFYQSLMEMKQNTVDPSDFWAAVNFWIFFAVGHPVLQPILWISDVLHGSPGPKVADLVPLTFIVANVLVIGATLLSSQLRTALNIAALSAFLTYVGAGLDGQAGLGDYNLALDDPYEGKIVKGCPAYEDVKLDTMNKFNIQNYQGKWYEHKFHDWTQFKEVYDTTLDIKLINDGNGWIDDFAVKGPSPLSAKLSWDKSPVANGAHYFLFGRVDSNDPPGILREKGFGVEFPNYIVDVQTNEETGEYTEAIQFQCLERGGVRVFEGINFLSRNPTMTDEQLNAMHERAKQAGMYPYGASPEQMHRVERRPEDALPLDNPWQTMWKAMGIDKLLELLTESIEDGGR